MTQDQFDSLLEQLRAYKQNLDFAEREKEEYLDRIIYNIENSENRFVNEDTSLEDIFEELREIQDVEDGGYVGIIFPNVNEEDEEYPDDYNPCDNEEYRIHSELLDELQEYLGI